MDSAARRLVVGHHNLSDFGVTTSLAAAPNGTLTLATSTGIYYLPSSGERWQPSSAAGAAPRRAG